MRNKMATKLSHQVSKKERGPKVPPELLQKLPTVRSGKGFNLDEDEAKKWNRCRNWKLQQPRHKIGLRLKRIENFFFFFLILKSRSAASSSRVGFSLGSFQRGLLLGLYFPRSEAELGLSCRVVGCQLAHQAVLGLSFMKRSRVRGAAAVAAALLLLHRKPPASAHTGPMGARGGGWAQAGTLLEGEWSDNGGQRKSARQWWKL